MFAKHMPMEHLTRFVLCMLALSVMACMADGSYESEVRQRSLGVDTTPDTRAEDLPSDVSPAGLYARLLQRTDIPDHERDAYQDLLRVARFGLAPSLDGLHAARSVCYSALTGDSNHSIIMIPLPSHTSDLDATCQVAINASWYAGGVAKPRYFYQECNGDLENTYFDGGYTSYVTESYFESHRSNYQTCGPTNAVICCSPQFPD